MLFQQSGEKQREMVQPVSINPGFSTANPDWPCFFHRWGEPTHLPLSHPGLFASLPYSDKIIVIVFAVFLVLVVAWPMNTHALISITTETTTHIRQHYDWTQRSSLVLEWHTAAQPFLPFSQYSLPSRPYDVTGHYSKTETNQYWSRVLPVLWQSSSETF